MWLALTRAVSPSITRCELTHRQRELIDVSLAISQHRQFEAALEMLGCTVERLPPAPDLPDAVFVEDTAVVLPECAVIARPGAASRRPETASVATALSGYRALYYIEPPGTLDGGDVLRIDRHVYIGVSSRTTFDAARQVERLLAPFGYAVESVAVRRCLHLKSAATPLDVGQLLVNESAVDADTFAGFSRIAVPDEESFAANVICLGRKVLCPASAHRTHERLVAAGYDVIPVDVSELAKAEGGLTCCSLIFDVNSSPRL